MSFLYKRLVYMILCVEKASISSWIGSRLLTQLEAFLFYDDFICTLLLSSGLVAYFYCTVVFLLTTNALLATMLNLAVLNCAGVLSVSNEAFVRCTETSVMGLKRLGWVEGCCCTFCSSSSCSRSSWDRPLCGGLSFSSAMKNCSPSTSLILSMLEAVNSLTLMLALGVVGLLSLLAVLTLFD